MSEMSECGPYSSAMAVFITLDRLSSLSVAITLISSNRSRLIGRNVMLLTGICSSVLGFSGRGAREREYRQL